MYLAIKEIIKSAEKEINLADNSKLLEQVRVSYLGKKGHITEQLKQLGKLPSEERKEAGSQINKIKRRVIELINAQKIKLEEQELDKRLQQETLDVTLPGRSNKLGGLHPITKTMLRITEIFKQLGFSAAYGPEIENDYYNFESLNFPPNHPARAMHDTFYFDSGHLLRTHTSPVQTRVMADKKPPIQIIAPGKVYRSDSDMTHTPMFHQVEGLLVDKGVNFANLKGILDVFLESFFESKLEIRLRPSYFPFTEPSAEVDIRIINKHGKKGKWLEVLGCGMVHPNVLKEADIDAEIYTGYAFGMGVERLAMLRYEIDDIRLFFNNDLRFLNQFS